MYYYIGIDISSVKHDAAFLSSNGETVHEILTFSNDLSGFNKLLDVIKNLSPDSSKIKIGMEETGIYHENLRNFLVSHKLSVYPINPLLTSFHRKSTSPRITKTDKIDAEAIARYLMMNASSSNSYTPPLYHIQNLRNLSRLYWNKSHQLSKSKTRLKTAFMKFFPEFLENFNVFSDWSLNLFKDPISKAKLSKMHLSSLENIIKSKGDRKDAAITLKSIAKSSIGQDDLTLLINISLIIKEILFNQEIVESLLIHMKELMSDYNPLISIPGVGLISSVTILSEIGNIDRFKSKVSLVAFAGIDPTIYESGKFKSKHSKISKRGSKYLRTSIYHVAKVASLRSKSKFRDKYLSLRERGIHHDAAIMAVGKNILHTIYSMLKTNTFFDNTK